MPRAGGAAKKGGKGGLIVEVVVVLVLIGGLGVGGYFWSRSSAVGTATTYMDAGMAVFKDGQPDTEALKRVLVKDQVAEVERMEGPLASLAKGPLASILSQMQASYTMGKADVGLKEGTVEASVTLSVMGQSRTLPMKVMLVREGLAWKVDGHKTQSAMMGGAGGGGGAPKL